MKRAIYRYSSSKKTAAGGCRKSVNSSSITHYLLLVAVFFTLLLPLRNVFAHGTQRYIKGLWFNGETFEARTLYVVEGVFHFQYNGKVDATIDLQGKYVV